MTLRHSTGSLHDQTLAGRLVSAGRRKEEHPVEARSERPLSGVRILDLTRFLAGPYCTMVLADLGAEVIKIEPPEGDESRHQKAYRYGDETAYYISANRNKRGIVLDLKRPEGRQVFYELVAHADVVVDNYRAQTLQRLGADYERLRQIKPDIICCSLTAFGDEGAAAAPWSPKAVRLQQMMSGLICRSRS